MKPIFGFKQEFLKWAIRYEHEVKLVGGLNEFHSVYMETNQIKVGDADV